MDLSVTTVWSDIPQMMVVRPAEDTGTAAWGSGWVRLLADAQTLGDLVEERAQVPRWGGEMQTWGSRRAAILHRRDL